MRTRRTHLLTVIVAVFVVGLSIVSGGSAATVSPLPDASSLTPIMKVTAVRPAEGLAPASAITCELSIDNPHPSSHVPETVNVVATWNCTAPVPSLEVWVYLFYGELLVGTGHSANSGNATLKGNAAADCVNGFYSGFASGEVTFPPGYSPPTWDTEVQQVAEVTC